MRSLSLDPQPASNRTTAHGMAEFEERTHVFILRIWREPREIEGATSEWRTTVEHVGSGEQRHARTLAEIEPILAGYLEGGAPKPERPAWLKRWLRRWRHP